MEHQLVTRTACDVDPEPSVRRLGARETDRLLDALRSQTARRLLLLVLEQPRTAPTLAEELDTSLQNVHHHLEQLSECGVITRVGETVSEKGQRMGIHGPAEIPVITPGSAATADSGS